MSRSDSHLHFEALAQHAPDELLDARAVAELLWRRRAEFRWAVPFNELVLEACNAVFCMRSERPTLTREQCIKACANDLRRSMRKVRNTRIAVPEPAYDPLHDLVQQDLIQRLRLAMTQEEFAELRLLCDERTNCRQIAEQRCPGGDARAIALEHARLRKSKRRLLARAKHALELLEG